MSSFLIRKTRCTIWILFFDGLGGIEEVVFVLNIIRSP